MEFLTSLYGIFIAQAYEYALHCRDDPKLMKYTVFAVTQVVSYLVCYTV